MLADVDFPGAPRPRDARRKAATRVVQAAKVVIKHGEFRAIRPV